MAKQHVIILTEEEIKAIANMCRVSVKLGGNIPYIQKLQANGGKSGFDKLMEKIKEINNDADGQ
jgi:hypothetical protein